MRTRKLFAVVAAVAAIAMVTTAAAHPREDDRDGRRGPGREQRSGDRAGPGEARRARDADPVYVKECGSCHLAYPPRMLPAASWAAIMGGLDRHFGDDAELDPDTRAQIERWLVERAGRERRAAHGGSPLRITDLRWFRHEHDEVPQGAAARPSVRSMANCAACHPAAASWDFEDDRVRIPLR